MIRIIVSNWQVCKGVVGKASAGETQFPLDDWNDGCCENHRLPARSFRQNAMHRLGRCIIAPLSKAKGLALIRCPRFSSVLNQHIQLLLCGFSMKEESQKLHHIIVRQKCRLFQKGFQHSGTGAKAVRSLGSVQLLHFSLQGFSLVLGGSQFLLANIELVFQFFKFFICHSTSSFRLMGKAKATSLLRLIAFGSSTVFSLSTQKISYHHFFSSKYSCPMKKIVNSF